MGLRETRRGCCSRRGGERYSTKRGNLAADLLHMKNHRLRMKPQVWVRSAAGGTRSSCRRGLRANRGAISFPVAGLVPATHVSAERSLERKEGVDGRVEPGHWDRGWCRGRSKQRFRSAGHPWLKAGHDGRLPVWTMLQAGERP